MVIYQERPAAAEQSVNSLMSGTDLAVSRTVLAVREIPDGKFELPAAICDGSCLMEREILLCEGRASRLFASTNCLWQRSGQHRTKARILDLPTRTATSHYYILYILLYLKDKVFVRLRVNR